MSYSNQLNRKSPLTLNEAILRESEIRPERHAIKQMITSNASKFEINRINEDPPVVTTILKKIKACTEGTSWEVAVSVDHGEIRKSHPPALKSKYIHREILARDKGISLAASLPHSAILSVKPMLRKLPESYLIRFGDLRYHPTTIFNPDGRRSYYDTRYPWCCLVRITTPRGWSGSGVLIGPRHVVTASHCVDWTPGAWITVDVLYSNGNSLATANGITGYYSSQVGPGSIPDDESDEDYAVIVLDQPLGERFGWLGSRTYDSGWDDETTYWHSIGYPQDFSSVGNIPAWQTNFLLNELGADYGSARLIRSQTFDNWPGQSGSPVFGFWDDGPHVVGVVSGQGSDYNYISGGSLLPSLVNQARSDYP